MKIVRIAYILWGVCVASFGITASADPIVGLYDTGVGNNGKSLPDGTTPDPHYTLTLAADGSTTTTVKTSASGFPINTFWLGDSASFGVDHTNLVYPGDGNFSVGNYDYQTTFTLPFDANSVSISLSVAADNQATGILLNGLLVDTPPLSANEFYSYTPTNFISSNVIGRVNTLTFLTSNNGSSDSSGPTGLRVDGITGTYTTVPEPASVSLIGFALLSFRRHAI